MTQYQIRHMDIDELKRNIEEYILNDFDLAASIEKGHTKKLHCGQTDFELMTRSVKENKNKVSSFTNEDIMKRSIKYCLLENIPAICDWLQGYSGSFVINSNIDGKVIGSGLKMNGKNKKFDKYESCVAEIVLFREDEDTCISGFYVDTAYPSVSQGERTNQFYSADWFLKNLNGEIEKIDELSLYIRTNYSGLSVQKFKKNEQEMLKVSFVDVDKDYNIYIDISGMDRVFTLKERTEEGQRCMDLKELKGVNNNLHRAFSDIRQRAFEYRDEIAGRNKRDESEKGKKIIIINNGDKRKKQVQTIEKNKNVRNIKDIKIPKNAPIGNNIIKPKKYVQDKGSRGERDE